MSSIEEQLVRDIAAVTKGVIVTESELLDARGAVDDRIDSKRQRARRRTVVAVAAATVVVAAAGAIALQTVGGDGKAQVLANPSPTVSDLYADYFVGALPTPALIDGFWRLDNGDMSILFREDGTVQIDEQGMVYSNPAAWGDYEISDDTITMTMTGGKACEGTQFGMRASLLKNGNMRALAEYGPSVGCTPLPTFQMEWEHVLPTSPKFANTGFSGDPGWKPLNGQALNGDWAAEGGGYVLEMTPKGAYYILDESADPIDQGQWSLQGSDLLLTSSADSTGCNKGDRLVLGNVQTVNPGTPAIRGTVGENSCEGNWTPKTWFLIPNAGS
ncbi:MAG: hypothetical protein ABI586_05280 [Candidatus Nanopelagicales bacterium]